MSNQIELMRVAVHQPTNYRIVININRNSAIWMAREADVVVSMMRVP